MKFFYLTNGKITIIIVQIDGENYYQCYIGEEQDPHMNEFEEYEIQENFIDKNFVNIYCDNGIVPYNFVEVDEIKNIESISNNVSDFLTKKFVS